MDDDEVECDYDDEAGFRKALMLASGGAAKEKTVKVDVMAKLKASGLEDVFPVEMWPDTNATRLLGTWVRGAKKYHGENAYVFADLKRSVLRSFVSPLLCVFIVGSCPLHVQIRCVTPT